MLDHREIVRDEQVRDVPLFLQVVQQIQNLRLNRHVEGGDRFVADNEIGRQRDRAGDADALPLTAGKFMRIPARVHRIEADAGEQAGDEIVFVFAARECHAPGSARR